MKRKLRFVAFLLAAPIALAFGWMLLPNSLFYRRQRPTKLGKWTNRAMAFSYSTGATPAMMSTLEVRRRRSGETQQHPLVIAEYAGQRYVVSMLGEKSEWVKNVQAAGGAAAIKHGAVEMVSLELVPVERRAPVLKAYLLRAVGARPHIAVAPEAPLSEFERVAPHHPVLRITPRKREVADR